MLRLQFLANRQAPVWLTDERLTIGQDSRNPVSYTHLDVYKRQHEERRLESLKARGRDGRQGPDGYVYVLTDAPKGQLLRLGLASE